MKPPNLVAAIAAIGAVAALASAPASASEFTRPCYDHVTGSPSWNRCMQDWALQTIDRTVNDPPSVPSLPSVPNPDVNLHGVAASGTYQGVLNAKGGVTVVYECAAAAVGAAASVNVSRCGVYRNSALALPGPSSVVAGTEDLSLAAFRVCWTATATFVDGQTRTTSDCTAPMPSGAAALSNLSGGGASTTL